jgi:hypothetical protein
MAMIAGAPRPSCREMLPQGSSSSSAGMSQPRCSENSYSGRCARHLLTSPLRMTLNPSWQLPLVAMGIFLLSRPYLGIVQDAYIYMGRTLADLDPGGVGRDLMFVHDGQFGFTLFRFVAKAMAKSFGLAITAKTLAAVAALAWFFAAFAFSRQFISGGAVWAVMIFTALLPATYGASSFEFAELIAIPRPFAEALVLAGLAALALRHDALTLCCMIAAALLHPLMALAGFGVFVVVRGLEDNRWFLFCAVAGGVLVLASALGVPFLNRLVLPIDASLKSLYESRSPHLFPTDWPVETFPRLAVQAATIVIAADLQQARRRLILASIVIVALTSIAISAVFGDWLSSLLIVQVQPWRAAWLMAAAAAMALGLCALNLWRRGPSERIVLASLVLSWSLTTQFFFAGPAAIMDLSIDFGMQSLVASAAAILALLVHFSAKRYSSFLKSQYVLGAWVVSLVLAASWILRLFQVPWEFAIAAPAHYRNLDFVLVRDLLAFPLCAVATYLAIGRPRVAPGLQTGFTVLFLATIVVFWDHRPRTLRMMEDSHAPPDIMRLIDQHQGEVFSIDGLTEAWFNFGRAQWASPLQGAPIVFSPILATEWRKRMQVLMDLRLADRKSLAPPSAPERADAPVLSQEGVRQLCARNDAPAWIIAPIEHGSEPPAGIDMTLWQLPEPQFKLTKGDGHLVWQRIDAYGLIPCAEQPHSQRD